MDRFDYVIVGAGAAGCVLAYRLSEDPAVKVCLIEAGPRDTHPFIAMPKGLAKVMSDPKHLWTYASEPDACTAGQSEVWVRGRVLGGSSSVNGMMYVRGQPADFDAIAELSSDDWSWQNIGAAYAALENHELGPAETRGGHGPLKVTMPTLSDELSDAQIEAGEAMGWPRKEDVNSPDNGDGIGYAPRTIAGGKRQSAAVAFLRPAEKRANLTGCLALSCPSRFRTWTLLIQNQACCQLHQGAKTASQRSRRQVSQISRSADFVQSAHSNIGAHPRPFLE